MISPAEAAPQHCAARIFTTIVLAAVMTSGLVCCHDEKDPATAIPPVFTTTPVDIAFDPVDSSFGDIAFQEPVLTPFGIPLPPDYHEYSSYIEYVTILDAPIFSATSGVVSAIVENPVEEGDYEIQIICLPGSEYTVIYDHVLDVAVLEASLVAPGDTLGIAGNWDGFVSHVEFEIRTGDDGQEQAYCPLNFGDSAFKSEHHQLLSEYNRRGFAHTYDTLCQRAFVQE